MKNSEKWKGKNYIYKDRKIYTQKQTQQQNKKTWASSAGLCQKHKLQHPHHVKVSSRGPMNVENLAFKTLRDTESEISPAIKSDHGSHAI